MKIIPALFIFISFVHNLNAQTDEFIDQAEIRVAIENGKGITSELLCNHEWVVTTAIMQLMYDDPDDNLIMDMGYSTEYTFHPDGTFDAVAIIDTDGTWELRENGKLLYLYNNFRKDEEVHHILLDNDTMKWYFFEDKSTFYQYLEKK